MRRFTAFWIKRGIADIRMIFFGCIVRDKEMGQGKQNCPNPHDHNTPTNPFWLIDSTSRICDQQYKYTLGNIVTASYKTDHRTSHMKPKH